MHHQKGKSSLTQETVSEDTDEGRNLNKLARGKIAQLSKVQEDTCVARGELNFLR